MIRKGVEQVIYYQAWDTSANAPKPGDVGNHTLQVIKDGVLSAATNSPSEVDATNAPGLCKVTLMATELNGDFVALGGVSSTSNVIIVPVMILTDTDSKGSARTVVYQAFDTANNVGKIGDVGNHTLRVITDGSSAAPAASPAEISAAKVPGLYNVVLSDSEMDGFAVSLGGKSSTSDIEIIPLHMATDRGRYFVETDSNDTLRQRIVDVIATRLATITQAEGYKTDAGNNVVAWSEHALAEDELPTLTYRDLGNAPEQATIGRVDNFLTVEVGGIAVRDATGQAQMREIIADVLQMVGTDETWSGLAFDTQIPSEDPDIIMLENGQFSAMITLTIEYNTERFNAYK